MNKVPAVLVCDGRTGSLDIAGVTVLDRMVIAAHRAGCAAIFVVSDFEPRLARTHELGLQPAFVEKPPSLEAPALLIERGILVDERDLSRVIDANGQLSLADGSLLPVRMTTTNPQPVVALGVAQPVKDEASAREAERKLWASLGSSADGLVDKFFNRPCGRVLSKILVHTSLSPNAVSLVSIAVGVAAAPLFATGHFILGALVLQLCAVVDCVDGDLARALFKQSALGKWLDIGGDQVVHFSVFLGIAVGVARSNAQVPALALGISAALGVLLCFPIIIRGLRQPTEQRGYILAKLMDSAANRDFTVLLLLLALIGRMDLFLWMAGIGIHVFWIALLLLQNASARRVHRTA